MQVHKIIDSLSDQLQCTSCGSNWLITDMKQGTLVCAECGIVVENQLVDQTAEWNNHADDEHDKSRVGGPVTYDDINEGDVNLETSIKDNKRPATGDSRFEAGDFDGRGSLARNQRRISARDARTSQAMEKLSSLSEKMSLSKSTEEKAKRLFKSFIEASTTRKKNLYVIVAAAVYLACRIDNAPRTLKEIAESAAVEQKALGKAFKEMQKTLQANVGEGTSNSTATERIKTPHTLEPLQVIKSEDYLSRFCSKLDLPHKIIQAATMVAKNALDMGIVAGKSPISVAAAAIYLVTQQTNEKKTEKEINNVTQVSEPTIRGAYKILKKYQASLLPQPTLLKLKEETQHVH